jgi:hypothetical protein
MNRRLKFLIRSYHSMRSLGNSRCRALYLTYNFHLATRIKR